MHVIWEGSPLSEEPAAFAAAAAAAPAVVAPSPDAAAGPAAESFPEPPLPLPLPLFADAEASAFFDEDGDFLVGPPPPAAPPPPPVALPAAATPPPLGDDSLGLLGPILTMVIVFAEKAAVFFAASLLHEPVTVSHLENRTALPPQRSNTGA